MRIEPAGMVVIMPALARRPGCVAAVITADFPGAADGQKGEIRQGIERQPGVGAEGVRRLVEPGSRLGPTQISRSAPAMARASEGRRE